MAVPQPIQKLTWRYIALIALAMCAAFVWYEVQTENTKGELRVTFFDVGQGDAALIESPGGVEVLIDGGPSGAVLRELTRARGFFDRSIELVVPTHFDKDHVSGLNDVLERYRVGAVLRSEQEGESADAEALIHAIVLEQAPVEFARAGMAYDLGGGATLTVLFPDRDTSQFTSNVASIVLLLSYGETRFLFMGDAPVAIEEHLVQSYGVLLESDVLKVGHHGSRTSTSETFLDAVHPSHAVISVGENNSYGHPHEEVTKRLDARGITTLTTAGEGSITFITDGTTLRVE